LLASHTQPKETPKVSFCFDLHTIGQIKDKMGAVDLRWHRAAKPVVFLICLFAVWSAGSQGPLAAYVQEVKRSQPAEAIQPHPVTGSPSLRAWIELEAQRRRIAPVNAMIDRVWKAIPGYDGREVDIQATYDKARMLGAVPDMDGFPWVYRSVPPAIGLDELPLAPIYRGNPSKPMVALMINVAWGEAYLPAILDTLDAEKVKATFFLDGSWLSKNESMAKSILERGHELSNHAYSHPRMSQLSMERQREEINRTEQLLKRLGVRNRWFAPPSGDFDARTVQAAGESGLRTVLWTLDTIDWKNPPSDAVVAKVSAKIGPGQLILMHPTATTKSALQGMIRAIRAKGLHPGTVSETLSSARVEPYRLPKQTATPAG
jgi:probable sporulation protein (polysaccharide deacetylase family)